ncbi:MAG: pantoate--beta-alanine ligase [Vibrio sp.]
MQTYAEISALREQIKRFKKDGHRIALVPTMGNLHEGHLNLVKKAHEQADIVIVSIFVNPMQFDNKDDLNRYPRTLEDDLHKLEQSGATLVFTPTPDMMYPQGMDKQTYIDVPGLSSILEGAARPGHFRGVTTIVGKLFNIVQPDVACFGEKDYQQLAIIRQMVTDLCMDITIINVPTAREIDGLAMSSRNNRLSIDDRQRAPAISRTMRWVCNAVRGGRRDFESLIEDAQDQLRAADIEPDEIHIRDAKTLEPITDASTQVVILMSAYLSDVRLIDNQVIDLSSETKPEDPSVNAQ